MAWEDVQPEYVDGWNPGQPLPMSWFEDGRSQLVWRAITCEWHSPSATAIHRGRRVSAVPSSSWPHNFYGQNKAVDGDPVCGDTIYKKRTYSGTLNETSGGADFYYDGTDERRLAANEFGQIVMEQVEMATLEGPHPPSGSFHAVSATADELDGAHSGTITRTRTDELTMEDQLAALEDALEILMGQWESDESGATFPGIGDAARNAVAAIIPSEAHGTLCAGLAWAARLNAAVTDVAGEIALKVDVVKYEHAAASGTVGAGSQTWALSDAIPAGERAVDQWGKYDPDAPSLSGVPLMTFEPEEYVEGGEGGAAGISIQMLSMTGKRYWVRCRVYEVGEAAGTEDFFLVPTGTVVISAEESFDGQWGPSGWPKGIEVEDVWEWNEDAEAWQETFAMPSRDFGSEIAVLVRKREVGAWGYQAFDGSDEYYETMTHMLATERTDAAACDCGTPVNGSTTWAARRTWDPVMFEPGPVEVMANEGVYAGLDYMPFAPGSWFGAPSNTADADTATTKTRNITAGAVTQPCHNGLLSVPQFAAAERVTLELLAEGYEVDEDTVIRTAYQMLLPLADETATLRLENVRWG